MKLFKIFAFALTAVMLFSACSNTGKAELSSIGYRVDVTHDGGDEKIIVDIDDVDNGNAGVKIYTTVDDETKLIWQDSVGTKENAQKGIYLCKKTGNMDLLICQPTEKDGETILQYSVFYLIYDQKSGTCKPAEEISESILFTDEQVKKGGEKYDEASKFVKEMNSYISRGIALIDTVGGNMVYSPSSKEGVTKLYLPDWYDKDYSASSATASTKK